MGRVIEKKRQFVLVTLVITKATDTFYISKISEIISVTKNNQAKYHNTQPVLYTFLYLHFGVHYSYICKNGFYKECSFQM